MATAAQICQAYQERSEITATQADRAVNVGQAAAAVGLPKGKKGGRSGSAHWGAEPLITHCVMLAVLSHDVAITTAAQLAIEYLNFRPTKRLIDLPAKDAAGGTTGWREIPVRDLASNELASGQSPMLGYGRLGQALAGLITEMARDPKARDEMELEATLFPHERVVQLSYTLKDGTIVLDYYEAPHQLRLDMPEPPKIGFRRTTTIPFEMFKMLADLLADTLARQASPPPSQTRGATSPPEGDNAGPFGDGPASSGQPHAPQRAQAETPHISEPTGRARVRASNLGWPPPKLDGGFDARQPNPG